MRHRTRFTVLFIAFLFLHAAHAGAYGGKWQGRKMLQTATSYYGNSGTAAINYYQWRLQQPIGPVGKPLAYYGADLAALNDPYCQQSPAGMLFYTPTSNCTTTSGTKYCRSEMREMTESGKTAAWNMSDGKVHVMTLRQEVRSLPAVKPNVVVAQIHNSTDDVIEVRCKGKATIPPGSTTKCTLEVFHNSVVFGVLDPTYTLNTPYTLTVSVSRTGDVSVAYDNDVVKSTVRCIGVPPNTPNNFFKAGAYAQSDEYPSSSTSVFLYHATIQHGP